MRLPEFLTKISPVRETLEAIGAGEAALTADVEEALRQVHVDTADRGLDLWEADYSLEKQGTDGARRAAVKTALAGGRTLTPAYLEELCRSVGGGDWGQVNEDFPNWTVTAYAAAFGRLPPGAEALDAAIKRLKPAHLAVEAHPAGVFALEGGWASALTGGVSGGASGDDGLRAMACRGAAPHGGGYAEASGGDGTRAGAERRAGLYGAACREALGDDANPAGAVRRANLFGGTCLELRGSDRQWDRFVRRGSILTFGVYMELTGRTA